MVRKRLITPAISYNGAVLTFILTLALDCVLTTTTIGTFFEEVHRSKENPSQRHPAHNHFHACSISSMCNFVVEDSKSQVYLYQIRSEIPVEEEPLGIWMKRNRYGYKVFTERRTWHEARRICQLHYGDLASILSKREEDTVKKLLAGFKEDIWFWLGSTDIETEGLYVWSDGSESSYTNWHDKEPNGNRIENCMLTLPSLLWYDAPCQWTEYFVCKIPLV